MSVAGTFDILIEASARAAVVAGFVALALAAFRVKTPAIRHAAWAVVLFTMLALPALSAWLPTIPLPLQPPQVPAATMTAATPALTPASAVGVASPPGRVEVASSIRPLPSAFPPSSIALPPTTPAPMSKTTTAWDWKAVVVFGWLAVAAVFLLREVVGWRLAHRLAAQAAPPTNGDGTYESARVNTPLVVGVWAPRVLVPRCWSQWGTDVRRMALAHERGHVTRRDPLVACLARVNRAVFWFHPIAWWMERYLARTAEQACDEIVAREVNDSRVYAALLVEMAGRLRHHGHRVAWQGIGIVSSRRLEDRIDRVLDGPAPVPSRRTKAAFVAACGVLVTIGVACGSAVPPLAEDPELAKELAAQEAANADYEAARAVTLDDLPALEEAVAEHPDDMATTRRLAGFYIWRGRGLMEWNQWVVAQRPHMLRMIAREPESTLAYWPLERRLDPEGYAQARALWMAHVEGPEANARILFHAALFFDSEEPFVAESLLHRGQAGYPDGPSPVAVRGTTRRFWSGVLGMVYGRGIVGAKAAGSSLFADRAREVLATSEDDQMLASAAQFLHNRRSDTTLGFDSAALARAYAERAVAISPDGPGALVLGRFDHNSDYDRMVRVLGKSAHEVDDESFGRLSNELRLRYAHGLIWGPHSDAMLGYQTNDDSAVRDALNRFEARAKQMLDLVVRSPQTNLTSRVAADAHIALGTLAMRRGKTAAAVSHLQKAAASGRPWERTEGVNEDEDGLGSGMAQQLAHELLDAGERESVAAFYETAAAALKNQAQADYLAAAKAIREGRMPAAYQRYLARLK